MKSFDKLNEVFDVEPTTGEVITTDNQVVLPETTKQTEKIEYDYDKSRSNLHNLLVQGQEALAYALEVAKQSEHPRAFEVVGNLMKNLSDINHQLLDLHKKKQAIDNPKGSESAETKNVTNNAIFVGSTSELSKMIANMKKGE